MNPASALGKLSWKKRKKRLGEKAFNEAMKQIAKLPRPSRRKLDKTAK